MSAALVPNNRLSGESAISNTFLRAAELTMAEAMSRAKDLVARRSGGEVIHDFDIRGELYDLALTFAPQARAQDIDLMMKWLDLQVGEVGADIAAGTGYLTGPIVRETGATVYAIDPSVAQLQRAASISPLIVTVCDTPDNLTLTDRVPTNCLNFATSFGGIHHVQDQAAMFRNISALLLPNGRFIAADVCAGTTVSNHFDSVVARKCVTGHTAKWLDEQKIAELAAQANLSVLRTERVALQWCFSSYEQAAIFFKGLHAYDISLEEIVIDLRRTLGVEAMNHQVNVNWPLLIFDVRKH